jgi:Ca-activated chloride channel homolog
VKPDGLRYQATPAPKPAAAGEKAKESFVVKMRHKKPDADTSTYRELPVTDPGRGYAEASEDFRFAAAVASFAMLLRDSQYKGDSSFALVKELAEAAKKHDPGEYRAEFLDLVKRAKAISGKP